VSRKSFTGGLESLFSSPHRDRGEGDTLVRPKGRSAARKAPEPAAASEPEPEIARKPGHHKTFTLDLDAFLQEVLNDRIREELDRDPKATEAPSADPPDIPAGIDALIRSTLETSEIEISGKSKRVTFFFDERKLDKLKELARRENVYLREIVSRIVADYVARIEREGKG
jgi:hypothetical protein